ncbi:MAG: (2Fe-2S)-binding protein [Pseudomonadota bacterium]
MVSFTVNGDTATAEIEPGTPLLWVLRDHLGLKGTKFGCGAAQCGACIVHLDGDAVHACQVQADGVDGAQIEKIEGLNDKLGTALKDAWIAEQVPQCGYCQPGMIMNAATLLTQNPDPSSEDIAQHMTNICRCGTYPRVTKAIQRAAKEVL